MPYKPIINPFLLHFPTPPNHSLPPPAFLHTPGFSRRNLKPFNLSNLQFLSIGASNDSRGFKTVFYFFYSFCLGFCIFHCLNAMKKKEILWGVHIFHINMRTFIAPRNPLLHFPRETIHISITKDSPQTCLT